MDIKLRVLKAKIRGLEAEASSIRHRIDRTSGMKRDGYWRLKRELGNHTRYHLIAYGLLRGIPYRKLENNAANVESHASAILDVIHQNVWDWEKRSWTPDRLLKLLREPLEETPVVSLKEAPVTLKEEEQPKQSRFSSILKRLGAR